MVSEFQFVAVLVAIVFGLSMTHVLSSTARAMFATSEYSYGLTRMAWTGFVLLVLLLNWWVTFSWREIEVWSFDLFLVLIIWAGSHYALVITLYPFNGLGTDIQIKDWQPRPMLLTFIALALLDYAQTAVRGELFSSPYYIPFTLHYIVLAGIAAYLHKQRFYSIVAWYFLISFFSWALIVRRFLA
jgi:hypothetical protein